MLDPRVTGGRAAGPVWPGAPAQWREDQRLEFKIPIFSVQFVPHCHNLSEQYWLQVGCAKFNLICTDVGGGGGGGLFGTTKRFLQYCLTTIVTLVYFCSQGYRNIKIQRQMWTFGSPQHLEWRGTSSWPSAQKPVYPRGPKEQESLLRAQSSDQASPALHVWSEISTIG